jgi:hypothetical protein
VARIKGAFRLFLNFRLVASFCFCKKMRFVARQNYYCIDYCAVWRASKVPLDFFLNSALWRASVFAKKCALWRGKTRYYCIDYCAVWRAAKVPLDFFKILPCGELLFLQKNALCGAAKLLLY